MTAAYALFISGLPFLLGFLGGAAVMKWGKRFSLLDRPSGRSSHSRATPKGGGIGILLAVVACCFFWRAPLHVFLPAVFISVIGFLGDLYDMDPKLRLFLQISAVLFLISGHQGTIFYSTRVYFDLDLFSNLLVLMFWTVFLTGTANFYNFMDGIDGIAAITGMVAFGLLAVYGRAADKSEFAVMLSLGVFFSCAGFLPWNFPKARVFMGDIGSLLLGFLFAAIVMVYTRSLGEFIVLISFIFPFYADELITMMERLRDKMPLLEPHRRHLYQVIVNEYGVPHWKVSLGYGLVQLLIGISVWKMAESGLFRTLILLALFAVVFWMVNNRLKMIRIQNQR